ncbi:MAG: YolD-like family protein [Ruminococcaceae bacterium]|nr:YolD-like family protein [Oscillospiraceae bacterium]
MGKIRAKMPKSQRAKQFAPFDAVVGLRQALKEKEKIRVPRKELSDDMLWEIDEALKGLNINDTVTVVHYNSSEQQYITTRGIVQKINPKSQIITLTVGDIKFEDIYTIIMSP